MLSRFQVAILLLALPALLALSACEGAGSAADTGRDRLLDRALAAYGSAAALEAVSSYRMSGVLTAAMRGVDAPTVRTFARPDSLRVAIAYPDQPEVRMVAGGRGWGVAETGELVPVAGPMLASMQLQAARAAVPWLLVRAREAAALVEPLDVEGRSLPGVEFRLGPGMSLRLYLDPETNLVARTQAMVVSGAMHTMFETVYSDYRNVNGVMFPFHEENFAAGTAIGTTRIDSVELNPTLDRQEFGPPPHGTVRI